MPAVFDVIRVAARQRWQGTDDIVNVFHWSIQAVPTPNTDNAVMQDLAEAISAAYAEIEGQIPNTINPVDLTFYNVTQDAPMGQRLWGSGYAGGTSAGEVLPLHDSCLVLMQTAVKRTQGRIYLPPFVEAASSSGAWTSTVATVVDSFASILLAPYTSGTFTGEYLYGVYRRADGAMAFPNSARISPYPAVQTRRKPGRGS